MAILSFTSISFLFFLLFTSLQFLNIRTTLARKSQQRSKTTPLVLSLRYSRTSLLLPKSSSSTKTPNSTRRSSLEPLSMMEPLREVRDGYLIPILLGTPPQVIQVYMDTGSDLTWVPCGNLSFECMDCDDYRNSKVLSTIFSPTHSPSSIRDLCGSSFCIDVHSSDNFLDPCTMAGCSLTTLLKSTCTRPCPSFAYTYGEGGVVTGTLTRDTLRVHESYSPNITKEIPNFCFGCVGSSHREPIGIAGFGRGLLSLPSQLGFLQKGFSHCFLPFKFANNPNMSSLLIVGDLAISSQDEKYLQFTPMLKSLLYPNYYYVGLEAIKVADSSVTEIPLSLREFDSNGNGGMLIDSGTTYTHLPEPFYSQLLSLLKSVISYPRAEEMETRTGFDLCYNVPYTNSSNNTADSQLLPTISFHFLNNVSIVLSEGSHFYAMAPPHNSTVVKCLLFQSMEDGDYGPAGVLGSFQQQNTKVVYDLGKERIGFQQMDCASAAASA